MTSLNFIMASTADARLIHLPGMAKKHEVFTAEQLTQDMMNLDNLVSTLEDQQDINLDGGEVHPLSLFVFSKRMEPLSLLYKRENARMLLSRPLLVQTRTQE
jgi:hypothetical protein